MTRTNPHVNPPDPDTPSLEHTYREGHWTLRPTSPMNRAEFDGAVEWYGATANPFASTAESVEHASRNGLLLERVAR